MASFDILHRVASAERDSVAIRVRLEFAFASGVGKVVATTTVHGTEVSVVLNHATLLEGDNAKVVQAYISLACHYVLPTATPATLYNCEQQCNTAAAVAKTNLGPSCSQNKYIHTLDRTQETLGPSN
eukprot:TRINITY_DN10009_c0_g1_i2.p2 TRINITY_DN10009_c0_g1~~TRINITY_DN10009_c0_g1_i2.p2  ORF type:complete len:127 (-),score=5.59 TRINITY_DN10009_c0_g1_i2:103-483(-)